MSSPRPAASSYAAVLRLPHARRTFGAALFGRLGYGVVSLSLVLALASATGSLPAGGLFGTEFAAVSVVLAPARAGLIDRWGARRALPALALPFAAALFVLAGCAHAAAGTPRWLLGVLVAAAGASCPPLGPTMRTLWAAMAPDEAVLQRAFSLDTVAEELIFLAGPLIVVAVHPVPGLVLSGAVIALGTLAMVGSPAAGLVAPVPKEASAPLRLLAPEGAGVRRAAVAAFGMGVCLAAVYLYVIAAADRAHHPAAAGWILAAQSAGSALGGLLYGRVRWRLDAAARLPYLLLVMAALVAVTAAAPSLPVLGLCVAVGGLLTSPTLSTAYLAASRLAPEGTATRATTWANSAINAGSSAGGGLAALLVDRAALPVCFLLAAAAPACAALAARGRTSPRGRGREPLRAAGAEGTQQGVAGEDVPGDGGTPPRSAAREDVPGAGGTRQGAAAEQAPGVDGNPAPTLSGT